MLTLRCTAKLFKEMGLDRSSVSDVNDRDALDSWFAHLLRFERRKCVLFTNAETLYSFFVPALRKPALVRLSETFIENLLPSLRAEGLEDTWLARFTSDPSSIVFARTNSKSVLGSMNDLAIHCEATIHHAGGLVALDLGELNRRLNRILLSANSYEHAIELFRRALQDH
jgi:hypothetical protein